MNKTLEQTARAAGLNDMALLKIVDENSPPQVGIAQLRQRYPGAFPAFDARTAPKKEVDQRLRELLREQAVERSAAVNERAIARIAHKYGDKK